MTFAFLERGEGRAAFQNYAGHRASDGAGLRATLIAAGVLRPGSPHWTRPSPPHGEPVLRIDERGRAMARQRIARGRWDNDRELAREAQTYLTEQNALKGK